MVTLNKVMETAFLIQLLNEGNMDLKVDRDTGDLVFTNGQCPITEDFADSTAQRVYIMLRTFQTEWYLNTDVGVPYLQRILGKKIEKRIVDNILQQKILAENGVVSIYDFESSISDMRVYEVSMRIKVSTGEVITETFSLELQ